MSNQPLSSMAKGRKVRLNAIVGGRGLNRRLLSLGISLGSEFEIITHQRMGVVLARDGNRVALGTGIAQKLMVEAID